MRLAREVRQREVGRFERREICAAFVLALAEVPDAVLLVVRHGLFDKPCESAEVEQTGRAFLRNELCFPCVWQWEAKLLAADSLGLNDKSGGLLQVGHRDPQIG